MPLNVHHLVAEILASLRPLIVSIARQDRNLADQLRRAATSVLLNIAEAEGNDRGHARQRFFTALGSAREVRAALSLASSWGYLAPSDHQRIDADLDHTCAMLYRLIHPRTPIVFPNPPPPESDPNTST